MKLTNSFHRKCKIDYIIEKWYFAKMDQKDDNTTAMTGSKTGQTKSKEKKPMCNNCGQKEVIDIYVPPFGYIKGFYCSVICFNDTQ